jgi:diguanylate cyclase (GGDEF)-like protein/PAS domain S-box-containing protein
MTELFKFALNSIDIGIIIIDSRQNIKFWNKYMEKISQISQSEAVDRQLCDICETFKKKRYQDILESVLIHNQSRFCSSKLHKAFVLPKTGDTSIIRQNMKIEPTEINNEIYALLQIDDITNEVNSEHNLRSLINELKRGYIEVKESEEFNKHLAQQDPLTKIANRNGIIEYIDGLFKRGSNLSDNALMFIDIDRFKSVNDTYGHIMGDNLLMAVAGILKSHVRKDDFVARIGGDEFLILLNNINSIDDIIKVGEKLINEIARPIEIDGITIKVTASIGIALYNDNIKSTNDFIKIADEAMYNAKRQGKNKFVLYKNA